MALGVKKMVKGVTRRVIVIKAPDPRLFEEAIFIVREDAGTAGGVTGKEIVREAQEIAGLYIKTHIKRRLLPNLPPPLFALAGAGLTGLIWWVSQFF